MDPLTRGRGGFAVVDIQDKPPDNVGSFAPDRRFVVDLVSMQQ